MSSYLSPQFKYMIFHMFTCTFFFLIIPARRQPFLVLDENSPVKNLKITLVSTAHIKTFFRRGVLYCMVTASLACVHLGKSESEAELLLYQFSVRKDKPCVWLQCVNCVGDNMQRTFFTRSCINTSHLMIVQNLKFKHFHHL